jgi:hypothetical protein
MTEITISKCIAPNCEREAALNSPLCLIHKEQLQKTEANLLRDATRIIRADMRQFERLIYIEPPLHSAEIAFRMAVPVKEVRKLLQKFKDDRT